MIGLVLVMSLGASDSLTKVQVADLSIKLPSSKDWKSEDTPEANGASKSVSAGEDAKIELSVFSVEPQRDAKVCVDQLVKALGETGYEPVTVGGQPAAKKVITDWIGESEEAKKDEKNKATTVSYVGCNGKTKWVMSMSSRQSKAARFGVVLKKVVDSIAYAGAAK